MSRFSFLSVDILIVSASAIRMSADRIRKPMDTIRMQTSRVRVFLNEKEERSGPFVLLSGALEEFFGRIGQTACSTKEKNRQKAEKNAFLGEKRMSNNRVVLWVCFSQFESLLWQSVREHRAIDSMKKREESWEVLVIY